MNQQNASTLLFLSSSSYVISFLVFMSTSYYNTYYNAASFDSFTNDHLFISLISGCCKELSTAEITEKRIFIVCWFFAVFVEFSLSIY